MTDPHHAAGVSPSRGLFWWLRGRSGRAEYWTYMALLVGLNLLLSYVVPAAVSGMVAVYIWVQIRRLHDFGRSGWWAVGAFLAAIALAIPLAYLGDESVVLMFAVVATLVPMIWIGAVKGDPAENRFGPPPPFTVRRILTGR